MTKVSRVAVGPLAANCYIVWVADGKDAVVVDPGDDYEKIVARLTEKNLTPRAVLLTHAHFDHCNAAVRLQRDGCPIYLHRNDEILLRTEMNMARNMGFRFRAFSPDTLCGDGDEINECGLLFRCLHTPGHTAGGVCYVTGDIIFSGDTLFCLGIGRSDMPTGNGRALEESIKKLYALPGDYTVFPGHGDATTLDFERKHNPYV